MIRDDDCRYDAANESRNTPFLCRRDATWYSAAAIGRNVNVIGTSLHFSFIYLSFRYVHQAENATKFSVVRQLQCKLRCVN